MCEATGANQLPFFNLPALHPFTHCKREILPSVSKWRSWRHKTEDRWKGCVYCLPGTLLSAAGGCLLWTLGGMDCPGRSHSGHLLLLSVNTPLASAGNAGSLLLQQGTPKAPGTTKLSQILKERKMSLLCFKVKVKATSLWHSGLLSSVKPCKSAEVGHWEIAPCCKLR